MSSARRIKRYWKTILLAGVAIAVAVYSFRPPSENLAKKTAQQTRERLAAEGYKLTLDQFDLSTPSDLRQRMRILIDAGSNLQSEDMAWLDILDATHEDPLVPRWSATETVKRPLEAPGRGVPGQHYFQSYSEEQTIGDMWEIGQSRILAHQHRMDAACEAILAGPIRFEPGMGNSLLLPHLAPIKRLGEGIKARLLLDLRDRNMERAWTNLLALTRIASAWEPEPTEISCRVRYSSIQLAYEMTWQALQWKHWKEEQLIDLQQEWERCQPFAGLSEIPALDRAGLLNFLRDDRQQVPPSWSDMFMEQFRYTPGAAIRNAFSYLKFAREAANYHETGSYEDETALLLYCTDRENEMKAALASSNWVTMQTLSGVTNTIPFPDREFSKAKALVNLRSISRQFPVRNKTFLMYAAEAETLRRILVSALVVERFRIRHGTYPESMNQLVPDFLETSPTDFMSGQPLRYERGTRSYRIWSVGLDVIDNGGTDFKRRGRFPEVPLDVRPDQWVYWGRWINEDILWPETAGGE